MAQRLAPTIKHVVHHEKQDGFDISHVTSMQFDDEGWLWISGISMSSNPFKLHRDHYIIQRYNGVNFQNFDLPLLEEEMGEIRIFKRTDGIFYIQVHNEETCTYFRVNPRTLEIYRTAAFHNLIHSHHEKHPNKLHSVPQLLNYKDGLLIILNDKGESNIYKMNSHEEIFHLCTIQDHIPEEGYLSFKNLIDLDSHFLINNERTGYLLIDQNGNILETPRYQTIGPSNDNSHHWATDYLTLKDTPHVLLSNTKVMYQYNWQDNEFVETKNMLNPSNPIHSVYQDPFENTISVERTIDGFTLTRVLIDKITQPINNEIFTDLYPEIISRDLSREAIVLCNGQLSHYYFKDPQITTYLPQQSIRSILQESEDDFIVATEFSGWYNVNTHHNTSTKIDINLNGLSGAGLDENRNIFKSSHGYYSNNKNGIIYIDSVARKAHSYIYYPPNCMVEDEHYIYYGTKQFALAKFDKALRQNTTLVRTDTLNIMDIAKRGQTIYGATSKGVLIHNDDTTLLAIPTSDAQDDRHFISILLDDTYGLLIGSRSGKVFQMDTSTYLFRSIYNDQLGASIASILKDHDDNLWINTFAGIVHFDPKTSSSQRYTQDDGLSFYECNRYSATIATDGRLLVGTLKGLNIFYPNELMKNKIDGTPSVLSYSYFDRSANEWITVSSPDKLEAFDHIRLPATNKNLQLEVGILGLINNQLVSYRYQLDKGDNTNRWQTVNNDNKISLSNLEAGKYTLSVEAYSLLEEKIGETLVINIHTDAFFYKTWWFYLMIALVSIAIALAYVSRLRKEKKLQVGFSQKLLNAQEAERKNLAREMHDGIGQSLMLLSRQTKHLGIPDLEELSSKTLNELRTISRGLHPVILERLGFSKAVQTLCEELDAQTNMYITSDVEVVDEMLPSTSALHLYRIIQEALSNSVKSAHAKAASVTISKDRNKIHVVIQDNGVGFQYDKAITSATGLGLHSIKERCKIIKAQLKIESNQQQGTKIFISI